MIKTHLLLPIIFTLVILPQSASFSLGSCSIFSLDGSKCQRCISNYHLYDGKCYVDILGCKNYNFGNICQECQNHYILVNNYCCDRACISQLYRQQNSHLEVGQVIQQSQVLQNLLQQVNANYFTPFQIRAKLTGISFQKYQDVTRFFLLYEILRGNISYKRLVYDYQNQKKSFILVDDSNLTTPLNFQLIPFTRITSLLETQKIISEFPTLYSKVNATMTLIKLFKLNRVNQYEIIVHNQNSFKSFYLYNGKIITLYDVILSPEYFKVFLFGAYADQALTQFKFLSDCKASIQMNSTPTYSPIVSFEIFNSSSPSEPIKVLVYSENSTSIIKSTFEIFLISFDTSSNISLISTVSQTKNTTDPVAWGPYFEKLNPDLKQVLKLIFSGYNSTNDIPLTYKDDPASRSDIQWQLKLQQWKVFRKFHLHITNQDSVIETTVVKFDFTNEYRINTFVKVKNVTQTALKIVNKSAANFTINNTSVSYERTIEGQFQIRQRMLERKNIQDIVEYFTQLTEYKRMGKTATITRLAQGRNDTHISYGFVCENITDYMRSSVVNITQNGSIVLSSVEYTPKVGEGTFNKMTGSPFFANDTLRGVTTLFSGLNMYVVYRMFNGSNPFAESMNRTLVDVYSKYKKDPAMTKNTWDIHPLIHSMPFDGKTKYTQQLMAFYACPTIPMVEYRLKIAQNPNTKNNFCLILSFVEVQEGGIKKIVMTGSQYYGGTWCIGWPGPMNSQSPVRNNLYPLQQARRMTSTPGNVGFSYTQKTVYHTPTYYHMSIQYLNGAFRSYANRRFSSTARQQFNNFRQENISHRTPFLPQTPYVRWMQLRTDTRDNATYMLVSYLPSSYFSGKRMPTYSGTFAQEYHHLCPPLDNRTYAQHFYFYNLGSNEFWLRPNVTNWYASVVGKDLLYNTSFVNNLTSPQDQATFNSSLQLLRTTLNSTANFSLYTSIESLKVKFKAYQLYMQRLNTSRTTVLDYMSILDLTTQKLEIVSTLPFFGQSLETFSLHKQQHFTQINNLSYFNSTIGADFQQYFSSQIPKIDQNIDQLLGPQIIKFLSLSTFENPTFQNSFKKLYYSIENLTNQSTIVTYVVEIHNLSNTSEIYGEKSTLVKSYVTVPVLIKYFTVKDVPNLAAGDFKVYILEINRIQSNSSIGNFVVQGTVEDKIALKKTVANFTVNYNFNYYSQGMPPLVSSQNNTTNTSYFNVVTFGNNFSQGTSRFNSLTSEEGRVLEDGEIVEIKYFPEDHIMKSNTSDFADYSKIYSEASSNVFDMIHTRFRERLSVSNLTLKVLMVEKLTDQRGFREYHMLIKVNLTYNSQSSLQQQSVIHILRFTYLTYRDFFTSMGSQFLPITNYQSILSDVKAEPNLYFEPLIKVSKLDYMQSFLLQTLNLINKYMTTAGSSERAVMVNGVYFRTFVEGGFYKVYVGLRSGNFCIGYMLERNYDYQILEVEILEALKIVGNTTNTNVINESAKGTDNNSSQNNLQDNMTHTSDSSNMRNTDNETSGDRNDTGQSDSIVSESQMDNTAQMNSTNANSPISNNKTDSVNQTHTNNHNHTNNSTNPTHHNNTTNSNTDNTGITSIQTTIQTSTQTNNQTNAQNNTQTTHSTTTNENTKSTATNNTSGTAPTQPTLEQIIFANVSPDSLYDYMREIIIRLRLQYTAYLSNSTFSSFNIKQSRDGQFFNLTFKQSSNPQILKYNVIVYRCNSTCLVFSGTSGSLFLLSFVKYQSFNGTIISNTNMATSTSSINITSNHPSTISESFYLASNKTNSTVFYMSQNEEESVISIFESIFNQLNITSLDTRLVEYQKYLHFLQLYQSLVLEQNSSKIVTQSMITNQVKRLLEFTREKYLTFLNNSLVLMIVQNQKLTNNLTNLTTQAKYALYMLVETLPPSDFNNSIQEWIIYKISITLKQLLPLNYQLSILNFTEFAKNGQLSTNPFSFASPHSNAKELTDIAFGYSSVNLTDSKTDADLIFTLNELKDKYFSLIINKTLTQIQKLQLKNGTTNYKLLYEDQKNTDKLKIIAVYKKQFQIVQILNKIYMPNENFRQVTQQELSSNQIINNTISLISQVHSQQITSPFITVTNIEVTSQSVSPLYPQNLRYRIQFISPLGNAFTSIIQHNPTVNSLVEVSFNEKIQLPQDSSYRLNSFEQEHALGWNKVQLPSVLNDPFYQIVINKLKANNSNFIRSMILFRKNEGTSVMFKIIYQSKVFSFNSSQQSENSSFLLLETVISVDPMNQLVEIKQPSYQLNLTDDFLPVLQSEIQQQELIELTSSFCLAMNFGMNQPIIIKQNQRKYFIDGMLMRSEVMVRMLDRTTRLYEFLSFRPLYSRKFVIWTISVTSLKKFEECSLSKKCVECADSAYKMTEGVCFLSINNCTEYLIDAVSDTLKCINCSVGYQLMDQKCINRQYYPELFA